MNDPVGLIPGLTENQLQATFFAASIIQPQQKPEDRVRCEGEQDDCSDADSIEVRNSSRDDADMAGFTEKFLDRLAEVMAPQKTLPRDETASGRSDADHVSATALIQENDKHTILLTKNNGFDNTDKKFLQTLQIWLNIVAILKRRPSIERCILWKKLLTYNLTRLSFYIAKFLDQKEIRHWKKLSSQTSELEYLILCCRKYNSDRSDSGKLQKIVFDAYKLRYKERLTLRDQSCSYATMKWVRFLGRLRAAWEIFAEFALTLHPCNVLSLEALSSPPPKVLPWASLQREITRLHLSPKQRKQLQEAMKQTGDIRLFVHAEMQLMLHFGSTPSENRTIFPYIGASKKPCWLCDQIIQGWRGIYRTRPSHGVVVGYWSLHMADAKSQLGPWSRIKIGGSLKEAHTFLYQQLGLSQKRLPAQAQSTAGVTGSLYQFANGESGRPKEESLVRERFKQQESNTNSSIAHAPLFGPKVGSVSALRLPATGQKPHIINIDVLKPCQGSHFSRPEQFDQEIPDLRPYWDLRMKDRHFQIQDVREQSDPCNNGTYMLYWCMNDGLPENKYIDCLLRKHGRRPESHRLFWRGDVFLVRFEENPITFKISILDVPARIEQAEFLQAVLLHSWDHEGLEHFARQEQATYRSEQKRETDEAILFERM